MGIRTKGLPGPTGPTHVGTTYEFTFGSIDGRWVLYIPSVREDRTFYAPERWEQQEWVLSFGRDAVEEAPFELSWYLRDDDVVRELLRRLEPLATEPLPRFAKDLLARS